MFEHTTKSGVLTIYEAMNGYYIRHNASKEVCGMGDGTNYVLAQDRRLAPAVAESRKHNRMLRDVEDHESEFLEAYFRHLTQ